ncbi:hypothetical protein AN214_01386 [Pseudoalteromonas sp. P1-9]|nr:hypothetical protein AN214_01386 [Pseudoalteromonas sp. P1-9]
MITTVKGSAGWPITAVLTPGGKPIWIDAYVPKTQLLTIAERFAVIWQQKPQRLLQVAENISKQVATLSLQPESKWSSAIVRDNVEEILTELDQQERGLVGAPKFPSEALLLLMLESYLETPTPALRQQLTLWLGRLSSRGIRDHVHGNFHRYATDAIWQVPHYEKMLYNQALLIKVFAKAGYLLNQPEYFAVAQDTAAFVDNVLKSQSGGYYSAIDADYFSQEGGYYLFEKPQFDKIDTDIIRQFAWYQYKAEALHAPYIAKQEPSQHARDILKTIKNQLPMPHIDKKVLLSWNALLADAFVELYSATGKTNYLVNAQSLVSMIETKLIENGRLKRAYYLGEAGSDALLEDYVCLAQAYHNLYTVTFDDIRQVKARKLLRDIVYNKMNSDVIRNTSDGELISPEALFYHLAKTYSFADSTLSRASRASKKSLQNAYLRAPMTSYSSAGVLLNRWQTGKQHVFAQGNGHIKLVRESANQAKIVISLKAGWHINSHSPNQKSLIATALLIDGQQINTDNYPQPIERKLGFSDKPLSLFEENVEISFKPNGQWLEVKLQACSDNVCLLPEAFKFKL